jgi:hypothetical protein
MAVDQVIFSPDTGGDAVSNAMGSFDISNLAAQLAAFFNNAGNDPISAMGWIFIHGGWIVFVILGFFAARILWLGSRQGKYNNSRRFVLLAIDIPRMSEQTVKAVDNMFAHMAGAHSPATFLEKWIDGKTQDVLSFEMVSIEGHIQFLIRSIDKYRDLIEASVYAQYPDAEITEVEDYTALVPNVYPNETHECFAVELEPVKSDVYPLKTYEEFEHGLTGEFKDPLAVLLEAISRLGPGEQAWYQIVVTPIEQKAFVAKAKKEIAKLAGREEPAAKKSILEKALQAPVDAMSSVAGAMLGGGEADKKKEQSPFGKMMLITPGERKIIEAVEKKMSKIQFLCKIRLVYIARKEVFSKAKIASSFIGAIKQFNTNDMQALKPESKRVSVSSTIVVFKKRRNDARKNRFIAAYRARSNWHGLDQFFLGTDELATMWHLPMSKEVRAPQVKKTESKKVEPPINIPFA